MLVGLGFKPLYAAGICLIANTAPVAFGAIGVPVIVAGQVSGFSDLHISAIVGRQLPFLSVIVPLWLCVVMCGFKRSMEVLPAIIVSGVCFAGSQFVFSNFHGPTLPDIMSAIIAIIGLVLLLRVWKPARIFRFEGEAEAVLEGEAPRFGVVLRAWGPYIILAVMVFFWGLPQFKDVLNAIPGSVIKFSWPGLDGLVLKAAPILPEGKDPVYPAVFTLNWLSAGGTAILIAGFLSVPLMPGYSFGNAVSCFFRTVVQLRFPILTIAMILGLAYLMNYSGMSSTLGIAFTLTGSFFPIFAPLLGWLGVFLTGSDTSSNALFCGMQRSTAEVVGMPPELAVAANSSGGVTGKMISPQSISVATAATSMVGAGGRPLPLRSAAQYRHDGVHLRADLAAGHGAELDAAVSFAQNVFAGSYLRVRPPFLCLSVLPFSQAKNVLSRGPGRRWEHLRGKTPHCRKQRPAGPCLLGRKALPGIDSRAGVPLPPKQTANSVDRA